MWRSLRHWLFPPKPTVGPEFIARMDDAQAFAAEQQQASVEARRQLRRARDERPDPTGIPTVDVLRGAYDPKARIYRGDRRPQ